MTNLFQRAQLGAATLLLAGSLAACFGSSSSTSNPGTPNMTTTPHATGLSLLAGQLGGSGNVDGTGASAHFSYPNGSATDSAGNVYVSDGNAIRKITPAGVVTTLAGSSKSGSADGAGTAATFSGPVGLATDSTGNIYVADENASLIRKITSSGVVTTLAGTGTNGAADGTGRNASFYYPTSLATDSAGNIYVADMGNDTIRMITPAGVVTTVAGTAGTRGASDGTGTAALFNSPQGIASDSSGNLYVADTSNYTIRMIAPGGIVTTVAGTAATQGSTDGIGPLASFGSPQGIATDNAGNVYVADPAYNTIRKIGAGAVVTTLAGVSGTSGSTDGPGATATFNGPGGISTDSTGNIYVPDSNNAIVRKITPTATVSTFAGSVAHNGSVDGTGASASFSNPRGLASDSAGNVYVADTNNSTIRKITPAGVTSILAGTVGVNGSTDGPGASASFGYPRGIAIDSAGTLYVADTDNNTIRKVTPAGVVSTFAGSGNSDTTDGKGTLASFNQPAGIAVDSTGNVYVADTRNATIRKILPDGTVSTLAGNPGQSGRGDGTGMGASFNNPTGLTVDSAGNVYVADAANSAIRKVTSAGVVTTFAGRSGTSGFADGTGISATFNRPQGIVMDGSGNLYVADTNNNTLRKITSAGVVTTVVGTAGSIGVILGALPGSLNGPICIATNSSGALFTVSESSILMAFVP